MKIVDQIVSAWVAAIDEVAFAFDGLPPEVRDALAEPAPATDAAERADAAALAGDPITAQACITEWGVAWMYAIEEARKSAKPRDL